jgi:Flp pilus assembly pilin Flp
MNQIVSDSAHAPRSLSLLTRLRCGTGSLVKRFSKDRSGVAALEFALLVPLMMIMYVGMVEITEAVYVDRRVTLMTRVTGDLIAREKREDDPMSEFVKSVTTGVSPMLPAKVAGTKVRITTYGIDGGGPPAAPLRAFVDWQISCTITGLNNAGAPDVSCAIGSDAVFGPDMPRCMIDESISQSSMRRGTQLFVVETRYTHIPILASLISAGSGAAWFNFIDPTGFKLKSVYPTWPRANERSEGPNNANMSVKANASFDQKKAPADSTVCGASGIPLAQRFVP